MHGKPPFHELRRLQRDFLQLRWEAICARGDGAFFARHIDTNAVTFALGDIPDALIVPGARPASLTNTTVSRRNLPSYVDASSPLLSPWFLFLDAATCGLTTRRHKLTDFGDGMLSYDSRKVRVQFFKENVRSFKGRRLTIAIALAYVWLSVGLIMFWVFRIVTGEYSRLTVPPWGSGIIHLLLCLAVVLVYALGNTCVPPHRTVGIRGGSLPSLLPLVLQTRNSQFMSSYAWSSRYLALVRSLSVVLADCWLDVRELASGDRVTHEIAHAAATVRCLVIFFSYEYLRSVNCSLEFLAALRHRKSPQQTIILLEALGETPSQVAGKGSPVPLTAEESRAVSAILSQAIPGLRVARNIPELIEIIDSHCIRAVDDAGIADTIDWWAQYGTARLHRAPNTTRVVTPLMLVELEKNRGVVCSCTRRRKGDVAGGFSLLRGDGSSVVWYRPPDAASLTMLALLVVEAIVYIQMFMYCVPAIDASTARSVAFEGSCLPTSVFIYVTSLLPLVMVAALYVINLRPAAANMHDDILLPLNVAAHSTGLRALASKVHASSRRPRRSISTRLAHAVRSASARLVPLSAPAVPAQNLNLDSPSPPKQDENTPERGTVAELSAVAMSAGSPTPSAMSGVVVLGPHENAAPTSLPLGGDENAELSTVDGFRVVIVTADAPRPLFATFSSSLLEFLSGPAVGVMAEVIRISALPPAAQRMTIYVFLLDTVASVHAFYARVHCAQTVPVGSVAPPMSSIRAKGGATRATVAGGGVGATPAVVTTVAWPTFQLVVACHADVLQTAGSAPPQPPPPTASVIPLARTQSSLFEPSAVIEVADGASALPDKAATPRVRPSMPPLIRPPPAGPMRVFSMALLHVASGRVESREGRPTPEQGVSEAGDADTLAASAFPAPAGGSGAPVVRDAAALSADLKARRRHALRVAGKTILRYWSLAQEKQSAPRRIRTTASGRGDALAAHVRSSLFEYLLIVTGPKAGVDASSPYASLAEALLDNVARKVGAVLEAGGADLNSDASAGSPGGAAAPKGRRRSRGRRVGP